MAEHATAECPVCNERFVLSLHGHRIGSGKRRIETQKYCGPACRQRAYRARLTSVTDGSRKPSGAVPARSRDCPSQRVGTSVTRLSTTTTPKSVTGNDLPMSMGGYRIVPDETWPNMFRLRHPDGTLSDLANMTRIRDALMSFNGYPKF